MIRYTFLSFSGLHDGVAVGACIVKCLPSESIAEAKRLGLFPEGCIHTAVFPLPSIEHEHMELNTFYDASQMRKFEYTTVGVEDESGTEVHFLPP